MPSREKLATFAVLLLASVSSVATSEPAYLWTAGDEESGEVTVADADQTVTVHVSSSRAAAVAVTGEANTPAGTRLDPPVTILVSPRVMYRSDSAPGADAGGTNPPLRLLLEGRTRMQVTLSSNGVCTKPCAQDVTLKFEKRPGLPPMNVHWVVKAGVQGYESDDVPEGEYVDVTKE